MDRSRRGFLKVVGGAILGGVPIAGALASGRVVAEPAPSALKATKWGMVVDIRKCAEKGACTACIDACHLNHNVPRIDNPEEEIKWIWKEPFENAFLEQCHEYTAPYLKSAKAPVLCNHCEKPACVKVCPTGATWKSDDGIVETDMHRCIGCRYCMAACPYGARSFNWSDPRPRIKRINTGFPTRTKGVVEKCNFCRERLAIGKLPVCVETCRVVGCMALTFGDLANLGSEVSEALKRNNSLRRKPELGTAPKVFYLV